MRFRGPLGAIPLSPTMAVSAHARRLAAEGRSIVSLAAGEPAFDSPAPAIEALVAAAEGGHTRYPPLHGLEELRACVARTFSDRYGSPYGADDVLITTGGKQGIFIALQALLDTGDEVLVPSPYWVSYPGQVRLARGEPIPVPMIIDPIMNRWTLTRDALEAGVTTRTVGLILNSPHNPTGWCLSAAESNLVADFVQERDLWVICDDVYSGLELKARGASETLLARHPELRSRVILVDSVSKRYAMTGWRLGMLAGPRALIERAAIWLSQSTSGVSPFSQAGALQALRGGDHLPTAWRAHYHDNHALLLGALRELGWATCPAEGAFYLLTRLPERWAEDTTFALTLLDEAGIATIPGSAFNAPGHLRLSFACARETLEEGLRRLRDFVASGQP